MQSFRQSNPVDNINELQENVELTKERLLELDKRLYDQIPLMLEIPPIRQLVIVNLELILKYFKLQITLNKFLNKKTGKLPILSYYFKFIIDLNSKYQLQIEKMMDILKNEEIENYDQIIILIKMYSLPFYIYVLGNNIPKLTSKDICLSITKNFDDLTLDPEKIKEGLKSMSEKIQSQITDLESNVTDIINENASLNAIKIPSNMNQIQDNMRNTMDNMIEKPGNMREIPGNMSETPGNMREIPGNMREIPGNMRETPSNMRETPGNMRETPGNMDQIQDTMRDTPGNMTETPGNMDQIQDNMRETPDNMRETPDDMRETPGNMEEIKLQKKSKKLKNDKKSSNSRTKLFNNNMQFLNGGNSNNLYNSIYDPIHNKWVKTNSIRGKNLINTYVVNLINEN